jgi:hypothetical protein
MMQSSMLAFCTTPEGIPVQKTLPGAKAPNLAPSRSHWTGFLRLLYQIPVLQIEDSILEKLYTNISSRAKVTSRLLRHPRH